MGRIALSVLVLCMIIQGGWTLSCLPCPVDITCPVLPKGDNCFPARAPCGCCDECAGLEGQKCGRFLKRCHPDLVCRNEKGEEKRIVKWYEPFNGICAEPECYDEYYDDDCNDK